MVVDLNLKPGEKIVRGICDLQKTQPFFAHLSMNLKVQEYPKGVGMGTMGVDARGNMYFDGHFVSQMDALKMQGLICHETLHCALQHMARTGKRYPKVANIAQDISVNMMVKKSEMDLPDKWVTADGHEARGIPVDTRSDSSEFDLPMEKGKCKIIIKQVSEKPWEVIYNEVLEQMHKQGKDPDKTGEGGMGFDEHMPGEGGGEELSDAEMDREASRWRENLANAAQYAKQMGKLPAGMERIIDGILKSKVQWRQLLRRYMKQFTTPVDFSYHKPSRRSHSLEIFMPVVLKESCEVEIVIDTSGSIGGDEMKEFLGEVVGMARAVSNIHMWVTFIDAEVQSRVELVNADVASIMALKPKGGGGTDLEKSFDNIKLKNRSVPCVIVLTDGYTPFRHSKNPYPFEVIWCISEGGVQKKDVPYGIAIKMGE